MVRKRAIIEKVKKLLALSKSDNEHEAALAATKAQEILDRENLSLYELEGFDETDIKFAAISDKLRHQEWDLYLFTSLSEMYEIFAYGSKRERKGMVLIVAGFPQDLEVFEYVYTYLRNAIVRLSKKELTKVKRRRKRDFRMDRRDVHLYNISFKYGAAVRVYEMMSALRNERLFKDVKCKDLVVRKKAQVLNWVNQRIKIEQGNPELLRFSLAPMIADTRKQMI